MLSGLQIFSIYPQISIRMKTLRFVPELVPPFTVGVISRTVNQEGATGFNLVYNQVPCN